MRPVDKSFRVQAEGCHYWGVDVLPDGTVQFYEEFNPRDVYWTDLTIAEVLKGKENAEMKAKLGEDVFAELFAYLHARKYGNGKRVK